MNRSGRPLAATLALAVAAVLAPVGAANAEAPVAPEPAAAASTWTPSGDLGSLQNVAASIGADAARATTDSSGRPLTGAGVTVAVIDTGISPVAGLDGVGKVVDGLDLTAGADSAATRFVDDAGHGTYIAGIIAGSDLPGATGADPSVTGIAPGAQLLNVKVGGSAGDVDIAQVVTAIDWVVAHRADDGMNVRVLNLSAGTISAQGYLVDPLAKAVENAWDAGIVVVASAGNDGGTAALTMPAADPTVIAVGSADNQGTSSTADDTLSTFTNPGTAVRRPDLLAPGRSVVSLRAPGSAADEEAPLVAGDADQRLLRGTGTSQAAAVVSGAVALLLQDQPALTPDQVKSVLTSSATTLTNEPSASQGAGLVNIAAAVAAAAPSADAAAQQAADSTGLGTSAGTGSWAGWYWAGWYWAGWYWADWNWSGWYWAGWYWAGWYWAGWYWA
ncbi:S8 family serine peptidase [Pengzhenrongella sicca]|nr:S8 family serine peptidase [Pengzhenrongella sicca]